MRGGGLAGWLGWGWGRRAALFWRVGRKCAGESRDDWIDGREDEERAMKEEETHGIW